MAAKDVSGYNVLNFNPLLSGYKYSRTWRTNIMRTMTGVETRTSVGEYPTKSLTFTLWLEDYEEIMAMKKILYFTLNHSYAVPMWHYKSTATAVAGTTITMDTRYIEIDEGDTVLLTDGTWDNYEKQIVASYNDTSITTTTTISGGWGNGTTVYPVLIAEMSDVQTVSPGVGNNPDIVSLRMNFTETFRIGEPS